MATITTRAAKGSALTFTEVDNNFTNLNADGISNTNNIATNTSAISTLQTDKFDKSGGTISGAVTFSSTVSNSSSVFTSQSNNNQAGSAVLLTDPTSEIIRLTNASLISIGGIASATGGEKVTLINTLTTDVSIINLEASVAANYRIYTGIGGVLTLTPNASISFVYDATSSKWNAVGTFAAASSSVPTGAIFPYSAPVAPSGYLLCDGNAVSRSSYSTLFALIGTTHGQGDGATTFNVPDYRWSFMRGYGPNITAAGSGTADSINRTATFASHGFNRTGVKVRLSSGTLSGLAVSTDYWTIFIDANTLAFATSRANALSGTKIAISGANSAVIVQYEDPDAAARTASTVGANTAGNIGSYQDHDFLSHTHSYRRSLDKVVSSGSGAGAAEIQSVYGTYTSGAAGGNETRPTNIYVNYIIKV